MRVGVSPSQIDQTEEQNEFTEELAHWVCADCYPAYPAKGFCGTVTTRPAKGEQQHACVVCEYMVERPCERCGG